MDGAIAEQAWISAVIETLMQHFYKEYLIMHDFDVYTLWILEQKRQRARAKHLHRYAQLHQVKASQPHRQLLPTVRSRLQALALTVRALHARLLLPRRIRQDQPFSVQDSTTPGLPGTTQVHGMARHEEQSVAASP